MQYPFDFKEEKLLPMFTNISWTEYLVTVTISLASYYLFIGIKFYSDELKELLSGKRKLKLKPAMHINSSGKNIFYHKENNDQQNASFKEITEEELEDGKHLIKRVKTIFADASQKEMALQELKKNLHLALKEYSSPGISSVRSSINELILSESQKYGLVTLTEDEVDLLWEDLM